MTQSRVLNCAVRPVFLCVVISACAGSLVSCAGTGAKGESRVVRATAGIEDPFRTLEARAELEALHPVSAPDAALLARIVPDAPPPLTPGTPQYQRALTAPEDIEIDPALPVVDDDADRIDPRRRAQGVKLYTRARAMRQTGQRDKAIETLRQAERVDPGSAAVQRELGDAMIAMGDQTGAVSAYERGIELGDRSPRALVHVASQAAAQGDQDRIIALTTLALNDPSIDSYPMARGIAATLLGNAQIDAGYLRAGATTLQDALESFNTGSRDGRWRREIIQILSQRSQLWVKAGDAWAAIGAHGRAQNAYEQAASGEGDPPIGLVGRQLAGLLRQGQPSRATLLLLDHLQNRVGDLGDQERIWSHELSRLPSVGTTLADAIGVLGQRPGLTPSIRRSLFALRVGALDTDLALALIGDAGLDANNPGAIARVLGTLDRPDKQYDAAVGILETNPDIAPALADAISRTSQSPIDLLRTHRKASTDAAQLLHTAIGISLGRPDLIGHLGSLELDDLGVHSTPWLAAHAQALALTGRWDDARLLTGELERRAVGDDTTSGDDDAARQLVSARLVLQEPVASWTMASSLADDSNASIQDLVLGSQVARLLGDHDAAVSYLERASEIDPYDTNILEELMLLRGPASTTGDDDDKDELQFIVRRLGTNRPRSALFGLLRANELARNAMVREAESLLLTLNAQHPTDEIGFDLLLSIWKTQQTQGDEQALAHGIAWLNGRLDDHPNSNQTALTLAKLYFELDQYEPALHALERVYARTGSFDVARAIEQLLQSQLDRPEEARGHITDRLRGLRGIDPTIEYAAYLSRQGTEEDDALLLRVLRTNLPGDITLLPTQVNQLSQIVYTLAETVEDRKNPEVLLDTIGIIEQHTEAIGFNLARIKLLLLAQRPRVDLDELLAITMSHAAQMDTPEHKRALEALPAQSLIGEDRPHEAIALVTRMATHDDTLDANYIVETYRMLGAIGTSADVIGVLDTLADKGLMQQTIELTTTRLGTPPRDLTDLTPDQQRADLAYTAAVMASAFDREDQAMAFYKLSLSYDPDHAWSNNDYGYMLADKGVRLDDALRMLKRAADAEPNEASIIDSLAWARYKTGVFEDVVDPESGEVLTEGAVTLLIRANALDTDRGNATIMLHLGDAFWRAGKHDNAIKAWLEAENMLRSRIRLLSVQADGNQRAISAASQELREVRYRIQDAGSTGKPKVSPIIGETETD